jgi:hypothetical protein
MFRCRIGCLVGESDNPADAGDVHDGAGALAVVDSVGERRGTSECAGRVDCQNLFPRLDSEILCVPEIRIRSGVVHEDIHRTEFGLGAVERRLDLLAISYIYRAGYRVAAVRPDSVGSGFEVVFRPGDRHHIRARGSHLDGDGFADSPAATRHERNAVVE